MRIFHCDNPDLMQLLIDNGFIIICNENMQKVIEDDDAQLIYDFVRDNAPAAINDFCIE